MPNYYEILEIPPDATLEEIKKAHRRLVRLSHPDSTSIVELQKTFHQIQEAYETLSNPKKRKRYDSENGFINWSKQKVEAYKRNQQEAERFSRQAEALYRHNYERRQRRNQSTSFTRQPLQQNKPDKTNRSVSFLKKALNTSFALFARMMRPAKVENDSSTVARGIFISLNIDALESLTGTVKEISFLSSGTRKATRVKIPPSVNEGTILRFKTEDGDTVRACLVITPHPFIERNGPNIVIKLPVSLNEATNGTEVEIPTPVGSVRVSIPPKLVEPKKLRLKGRGTHDPKKNTKGDLFVRPYIVLEDSSADYKRADAESLREELIRTLSRIQR